MTHAVQREFDFLVSTPKAEQDYSATFAGNMSLPVHKWFRYTAGFSASWVRSLIEEQKSQGRTKIIDPFAGSGTVLLESEFAGVESMGLESQPYIYQIAKVKLDWRYPANEFKEQAMDLLNRARLKSLPKTEFPKLIESCYSPDVLKRLAALKLAWQETTYEEKARNFIWFVITSILRTTSSAGTAQWQYIQPTKTKATILEPFDAFERKVGEMHRDMTYLQSQFTALGSAVVFNEDARDIHSIPQNWGDLVVTSPPYANNYDYADATRLEMSFWGDINGWSDLQDHVRKHLVRACTQHVPGLGKDIDSILESDELEAIRDELKPIYNKLSIERLSHGGKKNYHYMIAAYFSDLSRVFRSLRRVTSENVLMCFVIGDSAPYGIHVPVDKWLGELAVSAGFNDYSFEKLRDRNVKWKNRKHRVPLHEGRLWING